MVAIQNVATAWPATLCRVPPPTVGFGNRVEAATTFGWTRGPSSPYDEDCARRQNVHQSACMNDTSTTVAPRPAIALRGVDLSLGRGAARVHILKDIDLHIGQGEAVGLVGPSGSGKSTLLMVMAGLERPDAGTVEVAGADLGRLSEDGLANFRGRNIGIVFQSFHLIPTMSALENVAVPLELAGVDDAFARAAHELSLVGLAERLNHYPAQLSGGEQQRVAIARALAPGPAIVVADEPTGNLDEATGRQIIELLFTEHAARRTTLVLVTHDAALASRCDRVVRLRSGRVEAEPRKAAVP
jgi:putative ABC transport system ATP-binding protein